MSHPILKTLSTEEAGNEIDGGRRALEAIINEPVRSFAYPNGKPDHDFTQRDRRLVETMGFDFAVSTVSRVATKSSDPYQLPRFTPWARNSAQWLARLLAAYGGVPE